MTLIKLRILGFLLVVASLTGSLSAKTSTSVTLASSLNPSTYGVSITFTATVTPSAATGTVTFLSGTTTLGTGTISSGKATFTTSTLAAGSNSITASYGGNSTYSSSTSSALIQTVNKASTSTSLTSSLNPSTYSASVTFTANVTPSAATGTVTFLNGSTSLGTGAISSGRATLALTTLPVGSLSITASYGGDANDTASTSAALNQTVNKGNPIITWATPAPITYGTALSATQLNATASVPGTFSYTPPSGTVLTGGTQTLSVTFTPTSTANYNTATSTVSLTVNKVTPTITWATPSAISYGTALSSTQLNATASVPGTFAYSPASGTVPAAGTQTLSVTFTPTDTTNYATATKTVSLTVNKVALTVTAQNASRAYGVANPTFTAGFTGFVNGETQSAVSGAASLTTTATTSSAPGTYTITAAIGTLAATNYTFGTFVNGTLTVTKATPTITWATPAAITYGTALSATQLNATASVGGTFAYTPPLGTVLTAGVQTLSVTFTPTTTTDYTNATSTVSLTVNKVTPTVTWATPSPITYGTPLSGTQLNATASVPGTFGYTPASGAVLAAGTQTLSVTFTPTDATDYSAVTKTDTLTVNKIALTVTAQNATRAYGIANPTFTAGFTGFVNGDTQSLVSGTASLSTTATTSSDPGTYVITAAVGTLTAANYTFGTFVNGTLTVSKATPTITWATPAPISYGTALSGTQLNATANAPGTFTYTPAAGTVLPTGTQPLSVAFAPTVTADYTTANAAVSIIVNKAGTTVALASGTNPANYGASVTFTATLSPSTATGTITFLDGTVTLATAPIANGTATYTTSTLASGSHSITGAYSGDSNNAASTSPVVTETINRGSTSVTLSSSANPALSGSSVTFTAAVVPATATGTVTFLDGSSTIGTGTLASGSASYSTSSLTAGAHSITASYNGDGNNGGATSSALTETITSSIQVSTTSVPGSAAGAAYSQTLEATGGAAPYAWSITSGSLPNGLTLNTNSGTIAGTATLAGSNSFTVQVTDANNNSATQALTIVVTPVVASLSPNAGPTGTVVTLGGTGFGSTQGTSSVTFNGTAAVTVTSWSSTSITLPVPAGATSGNVVVTVDGVGSNGFGFTVGSGYGNGFQYRRTIVLNHTLVPNTDQIDFPILFSGVYPYLANVSNAGLVQNANGYDIVFSLDPEGATQLDHEIDSYDPSTGTASFWIRIPTLSHTVDTNVFLFYGNASITTSQENKAGVWKNNYLSVYHLGNGTAIGLADSASAGYTLAGSATAIAGRIGGGAAFNGSNYLYHDSVNAYPSQVSAATLETWVKFPASSSGEVVFGYGANTTNGSRDALYWDGTNMWMEFDGYGLSGPMPFDSNWHHVVSVYGGGAISTSTDQLYRDGVPLAMSTPTPGAWPAIQTSELKIGGMPTYTNGFSLNGSVDEVRVSAGTRSADWVATEYANESSPSTFYTVQAQSTVTNAPVIQFLSPTAGAPGASLLIEGAGFQSSQMSSTVTFNGVPGTPTSWSDASITVTVPSGTSVGNTNVVVTVDGVPSNAAVFNLLATPTLTSVNPSSGAVGAVVTITGTGFGNTQGVSSVTFGGITATPSAWNATSITVPVPNGAQTGNVVVTVGGGPSNPVGFTVIPSLSISAISPSSGTIGTYVTITGTLFGSSQGSSTVSFNSTPLTPVNWSDSTITVVVPAGASSGPFSVNVSGHVAASPTFTVTNLPTGWTDTDIGAVRQAGTATYSGGTFTLTGGAGGSGNGGFSGNTDAINFAYQTLVGDGSIVARLATLQNGPGGVSIRETLNAGAADVSIISNSNMFMQYRPSTAAGVQLVNPYGISGFTPPTWMKLVRSGSQFSGYTSNDGLNWTSLGTVTVPMAQSVYVGLGTTGYSSVATATFNSVSVSSGAAAAPLIASLSATTATIGEQISVIGSGFGGSQNASLLLFNNNPVAVSSWDDTLITFTVPSGATSGPLVVSVAPEMNASNPFDIEITGQPLPFPWLNEDVGVVGPSGSATYANGIFSVTGTGGQFGGTADAMQFVYQPLNGDGSIVARVTSATGGEFGLMIRETLTASSTDAFVTYANSIIMQYRSTTGGSATYQSVGYSPASPYWLQLTRAGSTFTGYISNDGITWTQIGSTTINMAPNVYIGMVISGYGGSQTVTFDSVAINSGSVASPIITGISPTTVPAGNEVAISGYNFGQTQNGSLLLLNGVSVPVNVWTNTSVVATVPSGAVSGPLQIVVAPLMNTSNPFNLEVTTQPLPAPWSNGDIGAVSTQIGNSTFSGGVFTVNGGGAVIGGTADAMQFVYQPLSGDGSIVVHLTSLTNVDSFYSGRATQAGPMIRETLNANAADASVLFGWDNYVDLQDRPSTGAGVTQPQGLYVSLPEWMKLVRAGNVFTGYGSTDGVNWTTITNATVPMAQNVYIGFAVSGNGSVQTGTFDNISVVSGTTPTISAVTPLIATIGSPVTISGSNFGATQGSSTISFNGAPATSITSWSNSQVVALVPASAPTGMGPVIVTVNSIASPVTSAAMFTVINPVVASVDPPGAPLGGNIVINGSGFGASQNGSVVINGVVANVVYNCPQNPWYSECWSDTQIQATVSAGTTNGPLTVSNGGFSSNQVPFTITNPPVISTLSPTTGEPSTTITIGGSGFGSSQSTSTVAVGGINAPVTSWSDTQIVASVPNIPMNGAVSVTVAGITAPGPLFIYNAINQLTATNGAVTTYNSGDFGNAWRTFSVSGPGCSSCSPRGNVSNTFDVNGNLLTTTDANGNAVSYTYDANNNMTSQTAQLNGEPVTTSYTYNNFAEVLSMTDALGNTTTNTYDAKGNLLTVSSPAPNAQTPPSVTQFTYDAKGELTQILDPLNHQTTISYYPTGLIQSITDAKNHTTSYTYDTHGNRTSVIDPINGSAHPTTFAYDLMNRLTGITYPDNTTASFGYDGRGRRTSAIDQNRQKTTYAYDDADRLLSLTDAANNLTQYNYDNESNLTSITDANNHTTYFAYDNLGRVTQTTFPSTLSETYGYDQLYNLTSKTDRKNQTIQYVYDSLYRMTSKTYPDSTSANYVYDLVGKIQQVTDPTGTYGFAYDNMGRLIGTTTQYTFLPGHNFQNSYTYDAASNRTSLTAPDGSTNSYQYDTLNRLTTLTNSLTGQFGFGYDALSRRTQLTRPNGVNTNYNYDSVSHLLSVLHQAGSTTLDGAGYTYDYAGNRTSKTNYLNGITSNYAYDTIYELQQVTQGGSTTESYSYDAVGNRLSSVGVPNYSYNASNELTSNSSGSYTYDNNGNTLSDPSGKSYTWDFENRLVSAAVPGTGTVGFKYDPFGRRIQKSSPLGTTNYLYDGIAAGANVIEEVDSSGNVSARYTQEPRVDGPLSMLRGGTTSYYEQDGINSVTSLSNSAGAVANSYTYDSYGKLAASSGTLTNPFQYTGREFDSETTIYFNRARYNDPSVGRFFSEDPIKFAGGPDFYVYVRNSPVGLLDPSGLDALQGDIQALANIFPGSIPGNNSLTIPMACKDVRQILLAQGYQDSNSWGYNGPGSAFWNPFDHAGGWEWRTYGPGFHFRMPYDQPNPFKKCPNESCTLDQFHIDPHNPIDGHMWPHVKCDFLGWC